MQGIKTFLRMCAVVAVFGLFPLTLPLAAQAEVRVAIGVGTPVYPAPVVVAPAPVVVAPPPAVVYAAPVVVAPPPVVYGPAPVVVDGYYGYRHRHWKHNPYWRQW
jgi:hypothetical protein